MTTQTDYLEELAAAETAFIVLTLPKPENEDDELVLEVESNVNEYPELLAAMLNSAAVSLGLAEAAEETTDA